MTMTAIETLEAAIARLEELRDGATPGVWTYRPEVLGLPSTTVMSGDETVGYVAVGQFHEGTAELIAALSRTVEPMLAHLREVAWLYQYANSPGPRVMDGAIAIARAVLREKS